MESRSLFVFGTQMNSSFGYFKIDTLPNINPVYVGKLSSSLLGNVKKSDAENYISVSYPDLTYIQIYRT